MMQTRHRWFIPYAMFAGIFMLIVGVLAGFSGAVSYVVLAACGVAIAGMATTEYSVLAITNDRLLLCRASRIRQRAIELSRELDEPVQLSMVGSTTITSDWDVDGVIYTLTKRWEPAMTALAHELSQP